MMIYYMITGWCITVLLTIFILYNAINMHKRTEDVRMWANAAFDSGYDSHDLSRETYVYNKKFSVDAVVDAHLGAWH